MGNPDDYDKKRVGFVGHACSCDTDRMAHGVEVVDYSNTPGCADRHAYAGPNVLHPRTGHTTEPVKIPYGLPLTTNYIHNIRDINTIGTVL